MAEAADLICTKGEVESRPKSSSEAQRVGKTSRSREIGPCEEVFL